MPDLELLITQGPYSSFLDQVVAMDGVSGIRLNTIMPIKEGELERKLIELRSKVDPKTLWIDLKARQLRIVEFANTPYTAVTISHRIRVRLPNTIYFDNGNVTGKLVEIDGNKLILEDYVGRLLGPGESVNIIDESLEYLEPDLLTERDQTYVEQCLKLGIHHWMLSFVEHPEDVEQLKQLDPDAVVMAKVESKRGLRHLVEINRVADAVMAARGDLYIEIDYPHQIAEVMRHIRQVCGDRSVAASRMLGSLLRHPMPSCPDVMDVQFLKEMGYTRFLIGDDICFRKEVLMQAIRLFRAVFT